MVHMCDLANIARPFQLSRNWCDRVTVEFFNQVCFPPFLTAHCIFTDCAGGACDACVVVREVCCGLPTRELKLPTLSNFRARAGSLYHFACYMYFFFSSQVLNTCERLAFSKKKLQICKENNKKTTSVHTHEKYKGPFYNTWATIIVQPNEIINDFYQLNG
jgi:hypothetical protein